MALVLASTGFVHTNPFVKDTLTPEERRIEMKLTKTLYCYLDDEELKELDTDAASLRLTRSEFVRKQIRESEMKRLKLEATPNQNGDIKTNSLLIRGALKVAQSNGYVQATIVENNAKVKIDTKTRPRTIHTRCEEVGLLGFVVTQIINIFRSNSHGN